MSDNLYNVSSTPHIRSNDSVKKIMRDVVIALSPACLAGVYYFGFQAGYVIFLCVLFCVYFEWMFQKITKQPATIGDWSAVVTGVLLAMNMPPTVPVWIPIIGSLFAMVIVKQLFGGLGQNFINPALAARAFLQISYPEQMMNWITPAPLLSGVDAVTSATPLAVLKSGGGVPIQSDYINALIGNIPGSLGETCAIALILGGAYLLVRKVINWRIPVCYLGSFALLVFVFGREGLFTGQPLYELLIGGILLGAFFMATDYSTCPVTPKGQIIMGLGCGLLTFMIRVLGGYPEGVCYAILLMNLTVPLIDRFTNPRVYGVSKGGKKHA